MNADSDFPSLFGPMRDLGDNPPLFYVVREYGRFNEKLRSHQLTCGSGRRRCADHCQCPCHSAGRRRSR